MVLEKYYENLKTLHVGTMANRCYYVPLSENGENRSMQLSGEDWKFAYFPCVEEVPASMRICSPVGRQMSSLSAWPTSK